MTRLRVRLGAFVAAGIAVAVLLAVVVSPHASSEPDGLERVAIDQGFAAAERPHAFEGAPSATGLAGAAGVVATFAATAGLLVVVRRRARRPA